jgi:hypothetical protein
MFVTRPEHQKESAQLYIAKIWISSSFQKISKSHVDSHYISQENFEKTSRNKKCEGKLVVLVYSK